LHPFLNGKLDKRIAVVREMRPTEGQVNANNLIKTAKYVTC